MKVADIVTILKTGIGDLEYIKCIFKQEVIDEALTAAIAYIEAGTKEMPERKDTSERDSLKKYFGDIRFDDGYNTALDACAPIISKLTADRDDWKDKFEKTRDGWFSQAKEFDEMKASLLKENHGLHSVLESVTRDRDALQEKSVELIQDEFYRKGEGRK